MYLQGLSSSLPEDVQLAFMQTIPGLEEVKIIHGMGTGKLREGIRNHLRGMRNVAEFRAGKYGEGESGVTIVKLK